MQYDDMLQLNGNHIKTMQLGNFHTWDVTKNRTLLDMARSMLAEFNSPQFLWAEAVSTACHSSNRLYFRKGLNKTPYEILTGNKPNVSYFSVFGCKCFYLIKGFGFQSFKQKPWRLSLLVMVPNLTLLESMIKPHGLS